MLYYIVLDSFLGLINQKITKCQNCGCIYDLSESHCNLIYFIYSLCCPLLNSVV